MFDNILSENLDSGHILKFDPQSMIWPDIGYITHDTWARIFDYKF